MDIISNDVLRAIHERRSTRKYEDRQITNEQLDAILDAAIWAPSGGNFQSWFFTAIQKKEILLQLNELMRDAFQRWMPDDDYPGKLRMKQYSQKESCDFFFNAPTLIIAANRPNYENAMADCSLALENIFLAAHSLGLGSCYINQLHWLRDDVEIRDFLFELGIPKEYTICSSAVVGYIETASPIPARRDGRINIIR